MHKGICIHVHALGSLFTCAVLDSCTISKCGGVLLCMLIMFPEGTLCYYSIDTYQLQNFKSTDSFKLK
jgi:hypothetical protein